MADDKRTARLAEPEADARAKADGITVAEGSAEAAVTPDDLASLSVEFESAINPTPATRFEKPDMLPFSDEIRTPKSEVTKGRIDEAYFDAVLKVAGALRLIDELEPSQREVWDSYQLTLADSRHNPEKYKSMLDNRNQNFPEIGKYLEQAYNHQLTAEKMVGEFNRKEFLNYIEKQYGERAASSARTYLQTNNYDRAAKHDLVDTVDGGSLDIVFDIQTDKPNVPNYYSLTPTQFRVARFGAEQVGAERAGSQCLGAEQVGTERIGNERIGNERIGNEPSGIEFIGLGRVRTERVGSERFGSERTNRLGPFRSGGERLSPGWDYRETARLDAASSVLTNPLLLRDGAVSAHNNYFNDQHFSRANLFASQRVPENLSAQLASFITRPDLTPSAKYDSLYRDSVKRDLESIDHPRYAERILVIQVQQS